MNNKSHDVIKVVNKAMDIAKSHNHEILTLEHLLASILDDSLVLSALTETSVNVDQVKKSLDQFFNSGIISKGNTQPQPSQLFADVMLVIAGKSLMMTNTPQTIEALLTILELVPDDAESMAKYILLKAGASSQSIKRFILHKSLDQSTDNMTDAAVDVDQRSAAEEFLTKYALNLNKKAIEGKIDPVIGRQSEIDQAIQIFCRKKKNNPILVGEPGVGKTSIAEGIAYKIVKGEVPKVMSTTTLWSLNIGALVAGTKYRGDFEERMNNVIKAMSHIPHGVLFIDEIHMIIGAGQVSQGATDAANLLKPALSDGSLRVIGSTTFDEFRQHFEKDRALIRRFGKIVVDEPSIEDTKKIIEGIIPNYEEFHKVKYSKESIDEVVELSSRFLSGKLPDKAIDIIDMAGARKSLFGIIDATISVDDIEFEISKITKIPIRNIDNTNHDKLNTLRDNIVSVVFGQDKAIDTIVDSVYVASAGLREDNKTQGSYLFTGPTGVGKTELARQLASSLGLVFKKFDMSEYMEKHSVSKLIGAPPGYVGFDNSSGMLTNAIEENPNCVLLLDEIEKAHPDIFNILLQVMDDGRLTNSSGKTVDFRNVILIMTTNAGAVEMERSSIGFGENSSNKDHMDSIKKLFTPEFRNRIDAIIPFGKLPVSEIKKIVVKFLDNINTMLIDKNIKLEYNQEVIDWLINKGYDETMGARPMARVINDNIKTPLSKLIIFNQIVNNKVVVYVKDHELIVESPK